MSSKAVAGWTRLTLIAVLALAACAPPASGQAELTRKVKTRVTPVYPELARRSNISGSVKVLVVVSSEGNVKNTRVVGGNPILVNAAVDAVKKWKFEPAKDESIGTVEFRFRPQD